jgi:zinc transport system substrate-binding protein
MKRVFLIVSLLLAGVVLTPRADAAPPPQVIATIKPIHSLVAMVMQGVGEPRLLIGTGASPHTYSLKPSDARALQQADVVFWVGESLETFLEKPLRTLPKGARVVELAKAAGVTLLAYRDAGPWEAHTHGHAETSEQTQDHDHEHAYGDAHGHSHDDAHIGADMHIWLDPANARAIVLAAASALSEADPDRAALYRSNAERAVAQLQALDEELRQTLTPLASRPYIVFHDAYQYLEHRYGMTPVGSITVNPERQPSAQRVAAMREKITHGAAVCVFAEPQFEPKLVQTLIEGTKARAGVLDADGGVGIPAGVEAYPMIMRNLSNALRACLDPSS